MMDRISYTLRIVSFGLALILACSCGTVGPGSDHNGPQSNPSNPSGSRPESNPSGPSGSRSESKPEGKPESKPGSKPEQTDAEALQVKNWTTEQIKDPANRLHKILTPAQMKKLTKDQLDTFPPNKIRTRPLFLPPSRDGGSS